MAKTHCLNSLTEVVEEHDRLAAEMAAHAEPMENDSVADLEEDPILENSLHNGEPLPKRIEGQQQFNDAVAIAYNEDSLFKHILSDPKEHPRFVVTDGLIYTRNLSNNLIMAIPKGNEPTTGKSLHGLVIEAAHKVVGHFGLQKTSENVRQWYRWPRFQKDVESFVRSCRKCQETKLLYLKLMGKLHELPIPDKPWSSIGMDFVGPFPEVEGYNYLWVIVCRLTSMVHLILVHTTWRATELSWIFVQEIMRLHGLPDSIVSDQDSKFVSKWWREVHHVLDVKLLMSTSFHPQTNGHTEVVNRSIVQILSC